MHKGSTHCFITISISHKGIITGSEYKGEEIKVWVNLGRRHRGLSLEHPMEDAGLCSV